MIIKCNRVGCFEDRAFALSDDAELTVWTIKDCLLTLSKDDIQVLEARVSLARDRESNTVSEIRLLLRPKQVRELPAVGSKDWPLDFRIVFGDTAMLTAVVGRKVWCSHLGYKPGGSFVTLTVMPSELEIIPRWLSGELS